MFQLNSSTPIVVHYLTHLRIDRYVIKRMAPSKKKTGPKFGGKSREMQQNVLRELHGDIQREGKKRGIIRTKLIEYCKLHNWLTRSMYNQFVSNLKKAPTNQPNSPSSGTTTTVTSDEAFHCKPGRPKGTTGEAKQEKERVVNAAIDAISVRYNEAKMNKAKQRLPKGTLKTIIQEEKQRYNLPCTRYLL